MTEHTNENATWQNELARIFGAMHISIVYVSTQVTGQNSMRTPNTKNCTSF